jgi:hypothetical protein
MLPVTRLSPRRMAPESSTSEASCEMAKMPISTTRNGRPASSTSHPKSKRGCPSIGSAPTVEIASPISAAIRPRVAEWPTRLATMVSAKTMSEKYSHGPRRTAKRASGGAATIRKAVEMTVPRKDAQTPMDRARPGCPPRAMGNASNVVATADGVPGMPSSAAEISPPV